MTVADTKPARLDTRGLIAAVILGTFGALVIMVVPGFVMLVGAHTGLDDRSLGYIASWNINASAVAIGVATVLITRFDWRQLALAGLLLMALGTFFTAAGHTFTGIVVSRVCAGFGEGLAIAVSFAALGRASNPDRAFGIYLVVGLIVSSAVLGALPVLQDKFGAATVFRGFAGLTLLAGVLVAWLPRGYDQEISASDGSTVVFKRLAAAGLISVFLYFMAQGAVWSYFERIGNASGVEPVAIGKAMAMSSFAGAGGALAAIVFIGRCGRRWLLIASGVISLVSFWMLRDHVSGFQLIVAGVLFNFGWNLAMPLLSGICADADCRGRVVVAMGCIQTVGYGTGPALTATMLRDNDFAPSLWVSAAILVASLLIVLAGLRTHTRAAAVAA